MKAVRYFISDCNFFLKCLCISEKKIGRKKDIIKEEKKENEILRGNGIKKVLTKRHINPRDLGYKINAKINAINA